MKITKLLLMVLFLSVMIVPVAQAQKVDKIGFVDLSRLFDEYYKTKDYDKVLEGKHKESQDMLTKKVDEVKEDEGKLALLTEDKKAALQADIDKKKADLVKLERQETTNLTKERNEKIREILLEIEKVVSGFAQKEGYSLILNDRVLIYGNQDMDLTEQVLKILNEKQPK